MSHANVTPTQALSRLLAAAKQINADECKDESVFQALQGEIGVAEGVLRDYVEPEPVAYGLTFQGSMTMNWFLTEFNAQECKNRLDRNYPEGDREIVRLYAAPVAAQSAVAAASVPIGWKLVPLEPDEMMQIRGDEATSGYVEWERDGPSDGSDCTEMVDRIYKAMLAAAPLHEAGNAAAPERCANPAACEAQGCRNPLGRCEEASPSIAAPTESFTPGEVWDLVGGHPDSLPDKAAVILELSRLCEVDNAPAIAAPTEVEQIKRKARNQICIDGHLNSALDDIMRSNSPDGIFNILGVLADRAIDAAIATGEKHD